MSGHVPRSRPRAPLVLALYLAAVVAVLLLPVDYRGIVVAAGDVLRSQLGVIGFGYGWIEFVANIGLFVPIGILLTLVFEDRWRGTVLALALSSGAELVQVAIPSRAVSLRDIVANVIGAAIGAAAVWFVLSRRGRGRRRAPSAARPSP